MEKIIGCIGFGYVGKAVVNLFSGHYKVKIWDPAFPKDSKDIYKTVIEQEDSIEFVDNIEELNDCYLGVICAPTPSKEDGSCDTSMVEDAVKKLKTELILIKSTVTPGTTFKLWNDSDKRICFSPEFAGESKYWSPYAFDTDMKAMPYVIIGGEDKKDSSAIIDLLVPILGPTKRYYQTDTKTAETVKYLENTFFAMKVTFLNEVRDICDALKVDFWEVRELWLNDPRVNPMHTAVFSDKRGFGGKCFPKDTKALYNASKEAGYVPTLIERMLERNEEFTSRNK